MHEASLYRQNSFLTLTYADAPAGLVYRDHKLFLRRFVKARGSVRYFCAGEYGEKLGRPHFHTILFGAGFPDEKYFCKSPSGFKLYTSDALTKLWSHGHVTYGRVTFESAAYCARYVMEKVTGDMAAEHYAGRAPERAWMSLKPGIGAEWFDRFGASDVRPDGKVVVNGVECNAPKFYRRRIAERYPQAAKRLAASGHRQIIKGIADSSDARLRAKEVVKRAQLSKLKHKL